ncbi:RNA polymerase sigma-70 factor of ECF subfamily [alpha proteobacterium U9-1i]|nr:RNA polymerase sigma-70 factor of ECF subfamily [alpha proteobacterium U9-1i]
MNPAQTAERVARESYGRLLAMLAARTRNVAAAEDALADAFAAALSAWPRGGVPEKPEAWLFAAARRKLIDSARRAQTASAAQDALILTMEELEEMGRDDAPDRRLGLLFACAHPAIEPSVRTPLMLQTVLGFSAERIASAFLMEPTAMGQRLVRAKKKIRDAAIPFDVPEPAEWPQRLAAVLDAIYAAYGVGWTDPLGADPERRGLAEEAIWLGRVLVAQTPDEPEALGLLALMLHLDARRYARRVGGRYVPLESQDTTLWRRELIVEAERALVHAARAGAPGRFQYEAAIQSAHAARAIQGVVDWGAVVLLYDALARFTGSPVARLNHIAALARRDGAEVALAALEALSDRHPQLGEYQPFWALRADLCGRAGRKHEARRAFLQAIERESDPAVVEFLKKRSAEL